MHNFQSMRFLKIPCNISAAATVPEVRKASCPLLALFLQTPGMYAQLLLVQELVNGCEHRLDLFRGILVEFL